MCKESRISVFMNLLLLEGGGLLKGIKEGSVGSEEESACNAEDPGLIPESERSPGEGKGNPLWYSCLENSMDRGAGWATVLGVTKSWTRLSN